MKKRNTASDTTTVLVGGCFDILHYGHIAFLQKAKKLGNTLIVALESDGNVKRLKGNKRPIHAQRIRKLMLEALSCVDSVILLPPTKTDTDYASMVKRIRPSVIALTRGDPMLQKKTRHAQSVGARVVVIPKIRTPSTSQLARLIRLE